jgi:DNA (cytosine-5)-methyltransferase 1
VPKKPVANVIDLFSGAGGLSLGAARAGFRLKGAVEIDPQAMASHKKNFPLTRHFQTDISTLSGSKLRDLFELSNGDLTGIIGGPPCQGFSSMGKNDTNDVRNNLFSTFFRIVSEAKPKFYLAENVPGILNEKYSGIVKEAYSFVEEQYTALPPIVFKASDFRAPTTRTRVFFIGYLRDEMNPVTRENLYRPSKEKTLVKDALKGLPTKISPEWRKEEDSWQVVEVAGNGYFASRLHGHIPFGVGDVVAFERLNKERKVSGFLGTKHSKEIETRYANIENGKSDPISRSYKLQLNGFCPTLRAGTGRDHGSFQAVRPLHPTEPRVITPREAARLQGFPDWFQFSPTKWHSFRQIGSSVSPIIAERILAVIHKSLGLNEKENEYDYDYD